MPGFTANLVNSRLHFGNSDSGKPGSCSFVSQTYKKKNLGLHVGYFQGLLGLCLQILTCT